jgi:hypothetical protein
VHNHWCITLMTRGPLDSPLRVFHRPPEMPRGRRGQVYAVDVWNDIPEERRRGLLRYDNALPMPMVSRLIRSTTNPGHLVGDPFLGSGTTPYATLLDERRFFGGDLNPHALRFTMGRLLAEVIPVLLAQGRGVPTQPRGLLARLAQRHGTTHPAPLPPRFRKRGHHVPVHSGRPACP